MDMLEKLAASAIFAFVISIAVILVGLVILATVMK